MIPGKHRSLDKTTPVNWLVEQLEKLKASTRAKVEHPFRLIKCKFRYRKVRYKGLAKNTAQITLFTLSNLWMVGRRISKGLLDECAWTPREHSKQALNGAEATLPQIYAYSATVTFGMLLSISTRFGGGLAEIT